MSGNLSLSRIVAVDRLQACDRLVVVEFPAFARGRDHLVHALEPAVEHLHRVRAHARVHHALPRVDVVVRGQLALLSLERRVVGEEDPRPHADRPELASVADLGERDGRVRREPVRPREMVVLVEGVEDHLVDGVRVDVAGRLRIESGLGGREHRADHLRGIGLRERGGGDAGGQQRGGRARKDPRAHQSSFPMSASSALGSV
ncbi:MAG: hypothetical protein IPF73_13395 [Betaproteobacteria bacterium]|nr:hypothetical protein [Betaproteobacteria bacterium]